MSARTDAVVIRAPSQMLTPAQLIALRFTMQRYRCDTIAGLVETLLMREVTREVDRLAKGDYPRMAV
ncbi:MAG: hypothetical protein J0H09_27995 [Burkholderiales bacterium]|nr:hypothetical protein [Burkholderiales bacterium]